MPSAEVTLPDRVYSEITSLVEQGEFINEEQAIEELLSMGISAFGTTESEPEETGEELFTQAVEDQQDPAMLDDPDDGPVY